MNNFKIYDDWLPGASRQELYEFIGNGYFRIARAQNGGHIGRGFQRTLVSNWSISDTIASGFFKNKLIIDWVLENNVRLFKTYVVLSTASDTYQYHTDSFTKGSYTGLYYANLDWKPEWEGETHFSDDSMQDIVKSVSFVPGRLVLFDATIPHKSSQPGPMAEGYRLTLVMKFVCKDDVDYNSAIDIQDFIIDYNIPLTEKERRAVEVVQSLTNNIPHSGTSLFNHLYNTMMLMKKYRCSEDACLAALCHSLYGTEYFNHKTIDRDQLVNLIGEKAERMVEVFCSPDRDRKIQESGNRELLYLLYANEVELSTRPGNHPEFSFFSQIKNQLK